MKLAAVLKLGVAALATGALMVPGVGPANAATTYPPHVSMLYASPVLSGGYAAVGVSGDHLTGLTVKAWRGKKSSRAGVSVYASGTKGMAVVKVSSLLSSTAGRYTVDFKLEGPSVTGTTTTRQTYTVGRAATITSFHAHKASYGLYISGKTAKSVPVKISIKFGSHTYTKTVKSSSHGNFHYHFHKTSKGTYTLTAQISANKKYFSERVSTTYHR